jgi:hypothetical protein
VEDITVPEFVRCSCTRINDPWRRFCGGCGSRLAPACGCGFVNGRHDRYCGGCGSKVGRLDWPTSPPPSFFAPDTVRERKTTAQRTAMQQGGVERSYQEQTMPLDILDEIL